ncbi:hypothetical protein AOC36_02320 [Erysipelothrix larvae]|uniref:Fatty acid-binding protein DegV n=1 Tax=Erysipelothrix larvae TaxID=1514105 RepID=A0A0X8GYP0_9FIRM|nr:DUF1836 domain-containing protein [Erysipelothrix larvae]AMC92859.1 hypothetical protein AOC36_02320 [Erysipelothrix larvae]
MNYEAWIHEIKDFTLPRYSELPEIPLYLDQVLEYVNSKLMPIFRYEKYEITGSMINNYVKHKMMSAPIKKRYSRNHIAYIMTITILKQINSIPSISQGIKAVRSEFGSGDAYDIFIGFVEEGIRHILAQTYDNTSIYLGEEKIVSTLVPMKAACIAFAAKIVAEHALESLMEEKNNDQ